MSSQENKLPTAAVYIETIYGSRNFARCIITDDASSLMSLMEDFSDYCAKPLQARIAELEITNAALLHQRDFYRNKLHDIKGIHVAKDLGIDENTQMAPLIQSSESDEIRELKAENERLKKANSRLVQRVDEENDNYCKSLDQVNRLCEMMLRAQDQNPKLRIALESALSFIDELKNHGITNWSGEAEAKEALKGVTNE